MSMPEFTPCVVVDKVHIKEWKESLRAWRWYFPEIYDMRWCIIADEDVEDEARAMRMGTVHPLLSPKKWPQRERALTAFVKQIPFTVSTPYFLKVDTDCFPTKKVAFPRPEWFVDSPVFISSPWGYTKPKNAVEILDDWGDGSPIAMYPRLNLPFDTDSNKVCHQRIISYLYFGETAWHRDLSRMIGERLPVPSQDTFSWYVAERSKKHYLRIKFKKLGFAHVGRGGDSLRNAINESIK